MRRSLLALFLSGLLLQAGPLDVFMKTHTTAVIAMIGHSWVEGKTESVPLTIALQTIYGNAGFGFTDCYAQSILGQGAGRTLSGTWTDIDPVNVGPADAFVGADGYAANSTDVATPGNCQIRIPTGLGIQSTFDIHYLVQPNGGSFTYSVNSQTPVTVSTAGGSKIFGHTGAIAVTGSPVLGATRLDMTVTVAGSAGVTIYGADWRMSTPGVVLHPLGHSGSGTQDFLNIDSTLWRAAIAALAPDIVMIQLTINDAASTIGATQSNTNLTAIIANIHAVAPAAIIVLVADPQNGITYTPALSTYESGLISYVAADPSLGLVDLYANWYTYPTSFDSGLLQGNAHPSTAGGQSIANIFAGYLANLGRQAGGARSRAGGSRR